MLVAFCPSHLPVMAGSAVDQVAGIVSAAHCCCNTTHLYVRGVNRDGGFVAVLGPHFIHFKPVNASQSVSVLTLLQSKGAGEVFVFIMKE